MKYHVYYNVPKIVEFDFEEGQDLAEVALWSARSVSGKDAVVVQVIPADAESELGKDLPRKFEPELPPPPMPPLGSAGDILLARAA